MLFARPDRARHVRSLSLSPDFASGTASKWGRSVLPGGYMVSAAVRRAAKNLEVLRSFMWDGEELPPYDDMWFALRISCVHLAVGSCCQIDALKALSCPRLKFISTSLGSILPPPNSHVRAVQGLPLHANFPCPPAIRLQRSIRLLTDIQNRLLLAERWCFPWFISVPSSTSQPEYY